MNCKHCGKEFTAADAAALLGSVSSAAKARASRLNGKKGGRPRKTPKPLKP